MPDRTRRFSTVSSTSRMLGCFSGSGLMLGALVQGAQQLAVAEVAGAGARGVRGVRGGVGEGVGGAGRGARPEPIGRPRVAGPPARRGCLAAPPPAWGSVPAAA